MNFGTLLMYVVSYFGIFTSVYFLLTLFDNRRRLHNPKHTHYPSVTVVVPAYNEEETVAGTVESLLGLEYPKDKLDIVVVDDGSQDKTYERAREYVPDVTVIRKPNEGKSEALNTVLETCDSDIFGALDADSFVDSKALLRMVGYFNNPKVMAVTPSMKVFEANNLWQKVQAIEYLFGVLYRKIFAFMGSIHVTPGPFTMFRTSFFKKHGFYKTDTITEDIEIALRIQSEHYKIENSLDAFVYTKTPEKFMPLLRQRIRWYRGFLDNLWDYRHLFHPRFGNLGIFWLPSSLISVALVIVVLLYSVGTGVNKFLKDMVTLYNINFDVLTFYTPQFDLFYINGKILFISAISFIASVGIIYLAKRLSKDDMGLTKQYIWYFLLYMPLFALWWIVAIYYKVTGKKIRWAGKML